MIDDDARICFSMAEAGRRFDIDRKTLERAIHSGAMPCKKYGRAYLIGALEIRRWLEERAKS